MRTNEEIMDILDERKEALGLSISEIGRQLNTAKSAISMYFSRKRELPLNRIDEIARVFQIDVEYLLGFKEDSEENELLITYSKLNTVNKAKIQKYIQDLLNQQ